jgi:peptidoglycan/LPS O-acetylase OafA/YrhL
MGLIRLFMAVSVVAWHAGGVAGWYPYNGSGCVTLFFIVSGFYMTLVLNEKYIGRGSNSVFWMNRFLRLWPTYVVAAAFGLPDKPNIYVELYNNADVLTFLTIVLSNLTLIGYEMQDLLCLDSGWHLHVCRGAAPSGLSGYFLVPPGWSVGLEIWFYLAAPFLVRRRSTTAVFLAVGVFFFVAARMAHLEDRWLYRSFPPVLLFFMLGALSYHVGKYLERQSYWQAYQRIGSYAVLPLVLLAIAIPDVLLGWLDIQHRNKMFVALFVAFIPAWFSWSKRHRWDTTAGDLSYPVYMIHGAALWWTLTIIEPSPVAAIIGIAVSLMAAVMLMLLVERPIDQWRHGIVRWLPVRQRVSSNTMH